MEIKYIPMIHAGDMPENVLDYCVENEIQTHYQNDVTFVENNNNPFANWLRSNDYEFKGENGDFVGILST